MSLGKSLFVIIIILLVIIILLSVTRHRLIHLLPTNSQCCLIVQNSYCLGKMDFHLIFGQHCKRYMLILRLQCLLNYTKNKITDHNLKTIESDRRHHHILWCQSFGRFFLPSHSMQWWCNFLALPLRTWGGTGPEFHSLLTGSTTEQCGWSWGPVYSRLKEGMFVTEAGIVSIYAAVHIGRKYFRREIMTLLLLIYADLVF